MNEQQTMAGRPASVAVSNDPITQAQLREPVEPVLAGRDPLAMDETVGAHDGSDQAGAAGWSTTQSAGMDVATDGSEGRASSGEDVQARSDRPAADDGREPTGGDLGGAGGVSAAVDDDAVALLDLPRWTEHLHALPGWRDGDRASSMLLRQPPVRVMLTALRGDAQMGSDGAEEALLLLVLSGSATIEWRGETARMAQGEMAVVPKGGGWRLTSAATETLVLSTFWGTAGDAIADEASR